VKQQTGVLVLCTLFNNHEVCNKQGFLDSNRVKCAAKTLKTTNSCALFSAVITICKQQKVALHLDTQRRNGVTKHNEQVKKNRITLHLFIVATNFSSVAKTSRLHL